MRAGVPVAQWQSEDALRSEMISTPAGQFDVLLEGRTGGGAVVLLHGFPETNAMWRATMAELAALGYFLVAPNQRGYGKSFRPLGKVHYDLDCLAADIQNLTEAFGMSRYVVIGHDWGAAVAWWLASGKPSGLAAIVALSAPHPAIWRDAMDNDPEQRALSRYVRFLGIPVLPELLVRLGSFKSLEKVIEPSSLPPEVLAAYQAAWREPQALTAMLNWYRALLARCMPDLESLQVQVPAMLLHGSDDPFMTQQVATRSVSLCNQCDLHCIDGVGHWLPRSAPHVVSKYLLPFLSDVFADRTG